MSIKTFKRYENKYLMSESKFNMLIPAISKYMSPDEHSDGKYYSIFNIYYDTKNNDIIRNSLSKPYYKEKLRLRSYETVKSPDSIVFLEIKKKIGGVVSKRRAKMTFAQAREFVLYGKEPQYNDYINNQVISEIKQFLSKNDVDEKVCIFYDRMAFFSKQDKDFRLTFDTNITSRRHAVSLYKIGSEKNIVLPNEYLMEVKITGAIPVWLTSLLSELKIFSHSFSKYGTEYKSFVKDEMHRREILLPKENDILFPAFNFPIFTLNTNKGVITNA